MTRLERIIPQLNQTALEFWSWLSSRSLDPRTWDTVTWLAAIIALLSLWILWLLASRSGERRTRKGSKRPELMVSKGEVRQREGGTAQILSFKVSNLNAYSVQVLEITLKSELMSAPLIIDAAELLGPGEAAELEAPLPKTMSGDEGILQVFAFIPHSKQLYRLNCTFVWEAWAFRYKVSPLGQTFKRVKRLESASLNSLRKRAWFERHSSPAARAFNDVVDTSYAPPHKDEASNSVAEPADLAPAPEDIMQLLESKPQPSTLVNIPQEAQPDPLEPSKEPAVPIRAPQAHSESSREFPKDF